MVHNITTFLSWEAPEFTYRKKKADWYWALGLIIVAGIILAIIDKNFLLGVLVILAGGLVFFFSQKKPDTISVELSNQGIKMNESFYTYEKIDSFWITGNDEGWQLMIHIHRIASPLVTLPIPDDINPVALREALLDYLPEQEKIEPWSHRMSDYIGF